jgi:hypothetical protein
MMRNTTKRTKITEMNMEGKGKKRSDFVHIKYCAKGITAAFSEGAGPERRKTSDQFEAES